MRQHLAVILAVAVLLTAAAVLVGPSLLGDDRESTLRWQQADEVVVAPAAADPSSVEAVLGAATRETLADDGAAAAAEDRMQVLLRGRVVDAFHVPVRDAKVWLDFARGGPRDRGGRQQRVPAAVQTDADGRFAFQGQAFRNLRVSLLVAHPDHAPGHFERNLGESRAEMDVGELVMTSGGSLLGRVTDLAGIGVPDAEATLQPENDNRRRFERDRAQIFAARKTDPNGYFRFDHVPAGDWRVLATAPRHEQGRSGTVTAEERLLVETDDIRLGPGFELAGVVTDRAGRPVAEAAVSVRARAPEREPRAGRGGPPLYGPGGPGGAPGLAEHRASTDRNGHFHLAHLPGRQLDLTIEKEGYLRHEQGEIDAKLEPTLFVTLQDGLQVTGIVRDGATAAPVELFAVLAQRLRRLPRADEPPAGEGPRGRGRNGGGFDGGTPRGFDGDPGKPTHHPEGRFVATGLQEGVYALVVRSPAHARYRSAEFELRAGAPPVAIEVGLERGFVVSGLVRAHDGKPIAGAAVELRPAPVPGDRERASPMRWPATAGAPLGATTDAQGRFAIAHATAGDYQVVASARGHDEVRTAPFALAADVDGLVLDLGALGALIGRVLGATPQQLGDVRVVAVPIDDRGSPQMRFRNGSPFASVQPDGTYRIDDLAPGGYAVRAFTGDGMRGLFTQFFGAALTPDVNVRGGETEVLDVTLLLPETGTVHGSVLHNGQPAAGFQIGLRRQDAGDAAVADGRGGRGGFARMGREFNGVVDATGQVTIADVPAGSYGLTVRSARRGGVLHSEAVVVQARSTSEITISLLTATLRGQVTADDGTAVADLDGNVVLLPGLTELPENLQAWRRDNRTFDTRVEDGRFQIEMLPPGSYLAVVTIRGRERATAQALAATGQTTTLSIAAGRRGQ